MKRLIEIILERLENAESLDPAVKKVRRAVRKTVPSRAVRDVLHGVPLGHPLHPGIVQVPLGAWVSSAVLDVAGSRGTAKASRMLVALGVLSALPSALAGYTDWSRLHPQQARVGLVHSAANLTAIALYSASYLRRRRDPAAGKLLGLVGLAVVSAGGFLGGHLSYRQAAGVNHTEDVPHRFPTGWQAVGPLAEITDGTLTRRDVAGQPVLLFRRGRNVDAVSNICSHLSGPLDEGKLIKKDGDSPCVSCPWHGSVFELASGEVVHGPATAPLPRFDTRVVDGLLEVRLQGAG